eukprot:GHRR01000524.1.p1 GENE.GHRR01000524.1~~GHRR01000524.1.p1  ORF type:complete len:787 (+),score=270.20 GHRR01000524.1:160-2520(+)
MLPHDVTNNTLGQGNARPLAPRPNQGFVRVGGSHRAVDARHGLLSQQFAVLASSQPRSIPTKLRASAAVMDAPTTESGAAAPIVDFGYDRDIDIKYEWGKELGKGGNGVVRVVKGRATGQEYACKAIKKELEGEHSDKKKAGHVDSIRREVEVLRRLAGSLNIVKLVDVFEDEHNVYVVQELCKGGELWHRIGEKHYSERTVASFMRAVLRTIAQCHSHHILHRDIKPGNFMLLDDSDRAPLKAIDFGLATPFDPEDLPRRDLGLEGTPWYMAPEVLSSQVTPASDIWSAGVMAYQLLTGRLPFDDHRNPFAPSISAVWRSVLTDKPDFNMPWWQGMSDDAKDFVSMLLNRDPTKRPTAKESLKHRWLQGNSSERSMGKQIDVSVVARIQRFAQNNRFKRSVLRLIAEELLSHPGTIAAGAAAAAEAAASSRTLSSSSGNPIIQDPNGSLMQGIFNSLDLAGDVVDRETAAVALANMGYKLDPTEIGRLLEQIDTSNSGKVRRAALAASQIDWRYVQQNHAADWLEIASRAFASLDKDSDGRLTVQDIIISLRAKLPSDELQLTIQQAMHDAGHDGNTEAMDFEGFLRMLKVGSVDSLDQYDARWDRPIGSVGSTDRLQALLDASNHGSDNGSLHGSSKGRGLYAGLQSHTVTGSVNPSNTGDLYRDKSWNKPPVNFKFDFGNEFMAHKLPASNSQWPPETQGAPDALAAAAAAAVGPAVNATAASSYFNNGAVRGGSHFDKRMHGASLYRNAVMSSPGSAASVQRPGQLYGGTTLPTVREGQPMR